MSKRFEIPRPEWPNERKVIEAVTSRIEAILADRGDTGRDGDGHGEPPSEWIKGVADIATNAWRAKNKIPKETGTGAVPEELKGINRHIEAMIQNFEDMGVKVKDHTGSRFDYGLPLKVVATQPTEGLGAETVLETIKPTIYWNDRIIQMGEVVIATPALSGTKP